MPLRALLPFKLLVAVAAKIRDLSLVPEGIRVECVEDALDGASWNADQRWHERIVLLPKERGFGSEFVC